jgi:hypothetical protein
MMDEATAFPDCLPMPFMIEPEHQNLMQASYEA